MKKVISLILLVFASFLFVSCENKDEVADQIVQYYNEEWMPMNNMKEKEMNDIPFELTRLEKEHKEDEAAALVKDEIQPIVDDALDRLESVDTENKKVKKMNDMQIKAEQFAKKLFKESIVYFEGGEVSEQDLNQGEEELTDKYDKVLDYWDELMDQYNLEKTENEDEDSKFSKLKRVEK